MKIIQIYNGWFYFLMVLKCFYHKVGMPILILVFYSVLSLVVYVSEILQNMWLSSFKQFCVLFQMSNVNSL